MHESKSRIFIWIKDNWFLFDPSIGCPVTYFLSGFFVKKFGRKLCFISLSCMYSQPLFLPVEGKPEDWPIAKLHKYLKIFLEEVVRQSLESLQTRYGTSQVLCKMLAQTIAKERARVATESWKCDPKDECLFWERMEHAMQNKENSGQLLTAILIRYADEIRSSFSVRQYYFMVKMARYALYALLKPSFLCLRSSLIPWKSKCKSLEDRLYVTGALDAIRSLAQKGTIVLVPTHSSNWDSVVIGLVMQRLGLPPLSWGTGLNLFNSRGFRYVFNALGTYKVDRRKKNIPYLEIQKAYVRLTLEWGCHTLFYPGGTRTRSGAIEKTLKLGFLSTPFSAQAHLFQKEGSHAKKLFIVPVVLNYHCVLEADQLIQELVSGHVATPVNTHSDCCSTQLLCGRNLLLKESELFVKIGTPLDVMGHDVDAEGRSYDVEGKEVDLYAAFQKIETAASANPSNVHAKTLSQKIVDAYYRIHPVVSSHLIAFVAYELAQKTAHCSMHHTGVLLKNKLFMNALSKVYRALSVLYTNKEIDFTPIVQHGQLNLIFEDGLAKLGIYHAKQPLVRTKNGDVLIQNMGTLLYYHNRLTGYELEKSIFS